MHDDAQKMLRCGVRAAVRGLLCVGACSAFAAVAVAAEPAQPDEELEQVVVTGSRIAPTGFTTPTPVTVLGAEAIAELGIINIGAGANQLPAFRATTTPATNGWGSFNVGAQIVNLRGLGVNRNLVLVDGRRFAPVTRESTVDLNLIPSGLVERLDVVTGGASAAYGSDAIAGAVNVILNKNLTGIKAQLDYGLSGEGDGDNYHVALAGGSSFAGGRGHFVLGGEYAKQDGIGDCFTREYCEAGAAVNNSGVAAVAGLPNFVLVKGSGGFLANFNGVINQLNNNTAATAAIRNLFGTGGVTFDDAGNPVPYTLGRPASGNTGAGSQTVSSFTTAQLEVPVERYATYGHAWYDLNDSVRWFVEGSYGHVEGSTLQTYYFGAPISVFNDNPFVPAQIRALLPPASATPSPLRPAANAAAFNLAVLGQRRGDSSSEADTWRATTGLSWHINDKWSADTYYQYAETDRLQQVDNNLVVGAQRVISRPGSGGVSNAGSYAYWAWANDPVYNPADAALPVAQRRIVCRASISTDAALRAAAADCVPFNPFGQTASEAALDYVYGTLVEDIAISQHVVSANVTGPVAELWAGPLSIAAGLEFRRDETRVVHDDLSNLFAYFQNFGADYNGDQDVYEGYLETELPLARDMTGIEALSLNAAVRRTRYEISGFGGYNQADASNSFNATTWKVGMVWEPVDWARLRFTISRDIRAPNFAELFLASASSFTSVQNRFLPGNPSENPTLLNGGNPQLGPETGKTKTVGIVLQPPFIEGLSLSLDYYDIKVTDYIGGPGGAQTVVDRCALNNIQQFCDLITLGAGQTLVEVANANVNLQWLKNRGLDAEIAYRLPLSRFSSLPGRFDFRLLANHALENSTNLFGVTTDRVGETGGVGAADWTATLITGFSHDRFQVNVTTRFISEGKFNVLYTGPDSPAYDPTRPNSVSDNTVPSATYFNLNASMNFGAQKNTEVFAQVNNLFDRAPPFAPQLAYPTNPVYFDQIGRTYRFGVRMKF
jgi:outer membrane receptor protein involved in Fe transport